MMRLILGAGVMFVSLSTYSQMLVISNFEDCVLDGLKKSKSESAASLIYEMCSRKFSDRTNNFESLNTAKSAHLLCEVPHRSPIPIYFNRPKQVFLVNQMQLTVTGQTKDKIYAEGYENLVIFNVSDRTVSLKYMGRTSLLQCEIARYR